MDILTFFFAEVWSHRRNRFIAVGGTAVCLLFLTLVVTRIPWMPESLKLLMAIFTGIAFIATLLLMLYYVLKFAFLGVKWILAKALRDSQRQGAESLQQEGPTK
jgi:succinate dehydrogenase hydrophobic anchor subunit